MLCSWEGNCRSGFALAMCHIHGMYGSRTLVGRPVSCLCPFRGVTFTFICHYIPSGIHCLSAPHYQTSYTSLIRFCFIRPLGSTGKIFLKTIFTIYKWKHTIFKDKLIISTTFCELFHMTCLCSLWAAETTLMLCGRDHISRRTCCVQCWSFKKSTTFLGLFFTYQQCYCIFTGTQHS